MFSLYMSWCRCIGGIAPLIPMEVSGQFHVPSALPLNGAGCIPLSVFFGEEMNMLALRGTIKDCFLHRECG